MSTQVSSIVGNLKLSQAVNFRYGALPDGGLSVDENNDFSIDYDNGPWTIFVRTVDPTCEAPSGVIMVKGTGSVAFNGNALVAGNGCKAGTRAFRIRFLDTNANTVTLEDATGISAD